MNLTRRVLVALALLLTSVGAVSAQAATFRDLRWDFTDEQAAAYLASLGYVRAPGGPTPPAGIPVDIRAFHHAGNSPQARQAVLYQLRSGRLSSVHYTLRAPSAAVEAAKRALEAELDRRFGGHRPHPVTPGVLLWNTGSNVVTLRTEAVRGEAVLHVVYHAPGSREAA